MEQDNSKGTAMSEKISFLILKEKNGVFFEHKNAQCCSVDKYFFPAKLLSAKDVKQNLIGEILICPTCGEIDKEKIKVLNHESKV